MSEFFLFFPWDFYFLVTTVPCLIGMFCPLLEGVRDRTGWDDATRLSMLPDSRPVIVMAPKMCLRFWFPKGPACICAKLLQSCPTLQLYGLEPYGSSVHGILQAKILEWVVAPSSRGSSQSRNWTCVSCIAGGFFIAEPLGNPQKAWQGSKLPA